MKTHLVVNPLFESLRPFLSALPERFAQEGQVMYQGRNEIRVMETDGLCLNVKQFGMPFFLNRMVYHRLRSTKAQRAYEYAFRLREAGFNTPEPIAYIITQDKGLLGKCYFISRQVDYPRRFYEFGTPPLEGRENIVRDFARFTARLHNANIYHKDYSPGNILFEVRNGQTEFCLVDINRMQFGPVSIKKGCSNFLRLWGQEPFFRLLAKEYALGRCADPETCTRLILKYRKKFWKHYLKHKPAKFEIDLK